MNANRIAVYVHDGRAWVAEIEGGRARVSSLTAWLSSHPGWSGARLLAGGGPASLAPAHEGRPRATLAAVLSRLLGRKGGTSARPVGSA